MKRALLLPVLAVVLFTAPPVWADGTVTIVPPEGRISDSQARLALARMLSWDDATLSESLMEYRLLLALSPKDSAIETEAAMVLLRLGMETEAAVLLRGVRLRDPANSAAVAALADIECSRGHALACRDLYLEALQNPGERADLRLRFAQRMNLWGGFYKSSSLYREHLAGHPEDREAALRLANTLASSERYEEAQALLKTL